MKSARLSSLISFTYRRVFSTVKLKWFQRTESKVYRWKWTERRWTVESGRSNTGPSKMYYRQIPLKSFLNLRPSSRVLTYWAFISSHDIIFLITCMKNEFLTAHYKCLIFDFQALRSSMAYLERFMNLNSSFRIAFLVLECIGQCENNVSWH